jgi:ABC-type sugar transport system ATPase subunit
MGSPGMTMFRCRVEGDGESRVIRLGARPVELDRRELAAQPGVAGYSSRDVIVGVRPEAIFLGERSRRGRQLRGLVEFQEVLGSSVVAFFRIDGNHGIDRDHGPTSTNDAGESPLESSAGVLTPARFAAATRFTPGDIVELELEEGALRFFDPETGAAI